MRKILFSIAASAVLFSSAPASAKKPPALTPMELQALQTHEYETTKEVLFASVVSVFQDLGYQLENADMPSGFITASSANKNKTNFWEAMSYRRSSGNSRVTAFVEAMPSGLARVRLNFMNSKTSSGLYGTSKDDKAILDTQTYKVAWDKIDEAIFVRNATNAPAKPGTPASVTSSPAAISVPVTPGTSVTVKPTAPFPPK